ncbi:uncharacterized protein ALTATR162_LOCUS5020 [Alternaria atra]|uniref:Uncharacterized protein n=1 Tax=Alternaria atra TaxID=119953 RepID=A0A8J2I1L0_9PLEO|nr:uncharacterized protein ALTATR162_LOCUS5020 [Alternaria atra]CAG5158171.1 unnamed protein product [Alternaria atra]
MDCSTKTKFNFVNLKHPDDIKDEGTQFRIRRLAMAEVGKARRKPKTRKERNEIVLELRNSTEMHSSLERFGGGQIDPFSHYPIELDDSDRALLANIFDPTTNHSSQLRGCWYPVGLSCAAAFHNVLSNSQNFLFQKLNGFFPSQDDALALTHRHKALRAASEMMKDPTKHKSDEIIGTVASFMCHHALLGTFADGHWHKHRNALVSIVGLRGGYDAIDKEHLRITLTWADLVGCFSQDIPPVVPLPRQWESDSRSPPNSPRPHSPISLLWKQQLPMQLDWITIFDDIVQLISVDRAFNKEQLLLSISSGSWMEPTAYRLLSIRPLLQGNDRGHVIEEVCRLGTLLFLSPFWRLLGRSIVRTAAISRKLLLLLMKDMVEWNELKPLLVWVLYFAASETKDLAERSQYVFMLAVLMSGMRLQEWNKTMQILKNVLWVEKVFAGSDDLIRDEVMQIVKQNPVGTMVLVDSSPTFLDGFPGEIGRD